MSGHIALRSPGNCLRAVAAEARALCGRRRGLQHHVLPTAFVLWLGFAQTLAAAETDIRIGGTGSGLSTMYLLAAAFEKANPGVTVKVLESLGSTGGIKAVAAGAIDIGVSSRPLSDAERNLGLTAIEYAWTPLAFVVPQATGTTGVTTAQLADIYTGKMTAWPSGIPIRAIVRPPSDTNALKLKNLSAQMKDAVIAAEKRPGMLFALTDADVVAYLNSVPGAFGLTSLPEIHTGEPGLTALKLDGIEPDPAALADGSYPLYLTMHVVTGKTPGAAAAKFIDFVHSAPGREILARTAQLPKP